MEQFDVSQLSLVAHYDDLIRFINSFIYSDNIDNSIKQLVENCEKQRLKWLLERNELIQTKAIVDKLNNEKKTLETTLRYVRAEYKREVDLREKIQNDRDLLYKKLSNVQNILLEDNAKNIEAAEKILSSINLNKLESIMEVVTEEDDTLLSSIEFDKTDEDIMDDKNIKSIKHQISTDFKSIENKHENKKSENLYDAKNTSYQTTLENPNLTTPKKAFYDENKMDYDDLKVTINEDPVDIRTPILKSTTSITSRLSNLSQSLIKQRLSTLPNDLKVDNRKHTFVIKKIFRPGEKCGLCANTIGFCTSCYKCRDCRIMCHIGCKDKVPLPCVPYVSKANIGKQGRLILISDFAPLNCRPCIPALIVHCCTEIEKRGLDEIGLYRIPGSDKEVKELKEKILNSKNGIPLLNKIDIHVLCGVIKSFLRDLDESLITRLAWRDFVKAALSNDEEKVVYLQDSIIDLPIANRDTLAYLILHLQKVCDSPACKMTKLNLAKVFGPTIVGHSMRDPPAMQMYEEIKKQILVMESILDLENSFWENLLYSNTNSPIKKTEDEILCLNELSYNGNSFIKNNSNLENKRTSIGSRFYGGRITSGTLTPLKAPNSKIYHAKPATIKPLF